MPVWPFISSIAVILTLWGWRHDAWLVPLMAVIGYIGMRAIAYTVNPDYIEVTGCMWWFVICCFLASFGGFVPALLYTASAMTYPIMLIFGKKIEYMGLSPIIAEVFALLALLSIGADIYGKSRVADNSGNPDRSDNWQVAYIDDMAQSKTGPNGVVQKD